MGDSSKLRCPVCTTAVPADAWICPKCDHILRPGALDELAAAPEAMIVNDESAPALDPDDFDVVEGAEAHEDGRTGKVLIYASRTTSRRILHADVLPRRLEHSGPTPALTPYESFVLGMIDGVRSVQALLMESKLTAEELSSALLTLLDKKLITAEQPTEESYLADWTDTTNADFDASVIERDPSTTGRGLVIDDGLRQPLPQTTIARAQTVLEPRSAPEEFEIDIRRAVPPESPAEDEPVTSLSESPRLEDLIPAGEAVDVDVSVDDPVDDPIDDPIDAEFEAEPNQEPLLASDLVVSEPPQGPTSDLPPALESRPSHPAELLREPMPRGVSNNMKAGKLLEAALRDEAAGNLVSARMNMKLALSFDPENPALKAAVARLLRTSEEAKKQVSKGRQLGDRALESERSGRVDEAIGLLEEALALEPHTDPALYNRLGVLLAMKKRQFERGKVLIEQAIQLAPDHPIYRQNLARVLELATAQGTKADRPATRNSSVPGSVPGRSSSVVARPTSAIRTPEKRGISLLSLFGGKKD